MKNNITIQQDTENPNFYIISFPDGYELKTEVSETLRNDLENFGIIPESASPEEKESILQSYLIKSAQRYTELNLNNTKQSNGKLDTPIGTIEDEF